MINYFGISCVIGCAMLILMQLHIVLSDDIISTIAGTGSLGYSGDGAAATSAALNSNYGVAVDSTGIYFI